MISSDEYRKRRKNFSAHMLPDSIAIFFSAPLQLRNGYDGHYPYRQESHFYYLTGFNEPNSIAVLINNQFILFTEPPDNKSDIWHGKRQESNADITYPIELFYKKLPELLQGKNTVYINSNLVKNHKIKKFLHSKNILNSYDISSELRLFKSPAEIALMQKANDISIAAHRETMQFCKPNQHEYQLNAVFIKTCMEHGSLFQAYPPIIASHENTCTLHYQKNNRLIHKGDMVLIDAGCEIENYASDITRSFPANGKFSAEQKAIYEIVLTAQKAAINIIKPGIKFSDIQEIIITIIKSGLHELGLLKNTDYTAFYMHNSGHWLGLDTHDVGAYKMNNASRELQPNMVLTVEPGIYISENIPGVPNRFKNIGIRLEDDIVVTKTGHHNLTAKLPKEITDIENFMSL